ncbi:hypothetical protein GCM10023184_04780 [Flaviaesturariibacter amylovorans]|uniref:Uncharacterized protein n=2 Tax=Flaviaesturariibacter amylovorans TaxID=1084520 RepID=A0ABP8G986_9BACT
MLEAQLGTKTFRRHFRLYRDASYRQLAEYSYQPLDAAGDPGMTVVAYQLSYIVTSVEGRDTVPIGTLTIRTDSLGRLLPPRAGQPAPQAALRAWRDLLRGRLRFGTKEVFSFRSKHKLGAYQVVYDCRDAASGQWYWYLTGPVRFAQGVPRYVEYRIDPRSGRRKRRVVYPPAEKGPQPPVDIREPIAPPPLPDTLPVRSDSGTHRLWPAAGS